MRPMNHAVYLDNNATTPIRPEAAAAVAEAMALTGNPSSVHRHGRLARRIVEDAREHVAALAGAAASAVVFTSGGTEANALAIRGSGRDRILVSAVEHLSVLNASDAPEIVPVDTDGLVDLDALDAMLAADGRPALVSIMLANNETGVVEPVSACVEIARRHGALVHCDAVQAAGRIPFDVEALGVQLLTLSGHKIGGPHGVGALIVADDLPLGAQLRGGGQEWGRRAGTENVAGIAGFGAAAEAVAADRTTPRRIAALRDRLERCALETAPGAAVIGAGVPRLPNTSCLAMPGVASEVQVMALDLAGVAVSAGAACSSGRVAKSHVLEAMGLDGGLRDCAVRVSLGWTSTDDDVERFLEAWSHLYARAGAMHGRCAGGLRSGRTG